jgi:Zn ribbon nucleic-acid-binding protein
MYNVKLLSGSFGVINYDEEALRKDVLSAIQADAESYDSIVLERVAQNLVGIVEGDHGLNKGVLDVISEEIEKFLTGSGYECPACRSENTETYIKERKQNCLDCGFNFKVSEENAIDMESEMEKEKNITINCYVDQLISNEDGVSDRFGSAWFTVPIEWLEARVKYQGFESVEKFLSEYMYDNTDGLLGLAVTDGVLIGCGVGDMKAYSDLKS